MADLGRQMLIFLLFVVFYLLSAGADPPSTLKLVHVLYRHGDRSPVITYPKNPYPASIWPNGYGQLTQRGMRMHYNLGQYLRQRYNGFLNSTYLVKEIEIRSTDVDRTLMSAESNLAGLYPPKGFQKWNLNIPWQPIPVHTVVRATDYLLNMEADCARREQLWNEILHSNMIKEEEKRNKDFYDYVKVHAGVVREGITNIWKIRDTLFCEKSHNFTSPEWVTGKIWQQMKNLSSWEFSLLSSTVQITRLTGGNLIKKMLNDSIAYIHKHISQDMKMFMYSAHDTTVSAFLSALNIFNKIQPPYASCAMLELHEENGHQFFKLYYRNDSSQPAYLLDIPGCPAPCSLSNLFDVAKPVMPDDIERECKSKYLLNHSITRGLIYGAIGLSGFLLILVLIIVVLIVKQRSRNTRRYRYLSDLNNHE